MSRSLLLSSSFLITVRLACLPQESRKEFISIWVCIWGESGGTRNCFRNRHERSTITSLEPSTLICHWNLHSIDIQPPMYIGAYIDIGQSILYSPQGSRCCGRAVISHYQVVYCPMWWGRAYQLCFTPELAGVLTEFSFRIQVLGCSDILNGYECMSRRLLPRTPLVNFLRLLLEVNPPLPPPPEISRPQ